MKVRYSCTQNVASIIKSNNKKLINRSIKNTLPCNCWKKHECLLGGKCRTEDIVQKCVASVHGYPNKVSLRTAGGVKQRFYKHQISFNNECHSTDTTFSKYVWEVKKKLKIMPSLRWYIIESVPAYSNISKKCQLCLQEKFETPTRTNYLIKDQSLFQSAATLVSFYCLITSPTIRPSGKCPIRNIFTTSHMLSKQQRNSGNCQLIVK